MIKKISATLAFIIIVLLSLELWIYHQKVLIKEDTIMAFQRNEKILNFTRMFIDKVLRAEGEVPFEDRLLLENAVRDIGNQEILTQWQEFTDVETEAQAQAEVKDLLEVLIKRIQF